MGTEAIEPAAVVAFYESEREPKLLSFNVLPIGEHRLYHGPWRCFYCDEVFTNEHDARQHFGRDEGATPACCIKGSEHGLVGALREAEDEVTRAWDAIHSESTDAVRALRSALGRHQKALTAQEQLGYERGLADARKHPETLGLVAAGAPSQPLVDTVRELLEARSIPNTYDLAFAIALHAAARSLEVAPVEEADAKAGEPLAFGYTNWRGEFAERNAIPLRIERKESEWHGPGLHWVMVAFDLEKQAERDFLIKDIGPASTIPSEPEAKGQAGAGPVVCSSCDGTGDLIRVDGEWIGWCPCGAAANAGAGPVGETYYHKGKDAEHFERLSDKDFAWALTCAAQDLNDSDENVSEWMPVTALLDGAAERIKATLSASTIPSEPEAKGEAGAGPVGEAVAWAVYRDGACIAVRLTREDAWQFARPNGDQDVRPLYALPVEEPGEALKNLAHAYAKQTLEVERLTRERDAQYEENVNRIAAEGAAILRAETAEAALAETRERLEKTEAALAELVDYYDTGHDQNAFLEAARAALSTQESSAALAGDGKETGR